MERHHRLLAAAILLIGLVIRLQLWQESRIADDDALITFRYAQNLAHGAGFVYNIGERVLGTTTPLFTLLLAAGLRLGLNLPDWAFALNLISCTACVALLYATLEEVGRPWAGALAALMQMFSLAGLMMAEVGGMETPFYAALLMAAFFLYARGRMGWAAAVAGLAALTRPDGFLMGPVLGLAYVLDRRRLPWKEIGIYALVVLPWVIFAWAYFGSPVPNSLLAKRVFFHTHWHRTPGQIFQTFNTGKTRILLNLLALVGAVATWVRLPRLRPVSIWLACYLAFFMAGGVVIHYWYLPPYFTPLFLLAGLGLWVMIDAVASRVGGPGTAVHETVALVLVLVAVLGIAGRGRTVLNLARKEVVDGQRLLDHTHAEIGRWIASHTPDSARVYVGDIGYVGYISGRRILDPVGLVSPEAIPWNARRQPLGLIRETLPGACVIAMYGLDYASIVQDPWFTQHYRLAHRVRDESIASTRLADFDPARRDQYVPDYQIFLPAR